MLQHSINVAFRVICTGKGIVKLEATGTLLEFRARKKIVLRMENYKHPFIRVVDLGGRLVGEGA